MTIKDAWDYIQTGGLPAVFFALAYGGYRGWWYFGREVLRLEAELKEQKARAHEDLLEQRAQTQRWQDESLHLLKVASQSVAVVKQQTEGQPHANLP